MTYRVWIYCSDCIGVDHQGCFDGGSEERFLDVDGSGSSDDHGLPIETLEIAERIGYEATKDCGPWRYEVEIAASGANDAAGGRAT